MSFKDLCRILTRDPHHLTFAEVGRLTDYQINEILLGPDPRHKPRQSSSPGRTDKEACLHVWRHRGLSEEEMERKWQERKQGGTFSG